MKLKKIAMIISAAAIMLTMGVSVSAATEPTTPTEYGKPVFCKNLTDEQKAQLIATVKTKLESSLAEGKITQEQYDTRLAIIDNGTLPFWGGVGKGIVVKNMLEKQKAAMEQRKAQWEAMIAKQKAAIEQIKAESEATVETQEEEIGGDQDQATDGTVPTEPTEPTAPVEPPKPDVCKNLTDEQKAQLIAAVKTRLEAALTEGKITQEQFDNRIEVIDNGTVPFWGRVGKGVVIRNVIEKQKAAIAERKAKWDALTEAQKEEIYSLCAQKAALDTTMIDKYVEYGIIDADTAAKLKANIENQQNQMRTNGKMPVINRGIRGIKPPIAPAK